MNARTLHCRSCGSSNLQSVLSLGTTPLANALLSEDQVAIPESYYPLELVFCPICALVQITETVPPEQLFREYLYFSSFSDTMVVHAQRLTTQICQEYQLNTNSCVIEIASNDGYLLQHYQQAGIPVLGIEPARNIARFAQEERNIPTINEFFNDKLARELVDSGIQADVVHLHNVLAHVAELNSVVSGLTRILKPGGVILIEVPYVRDLIEHIEFDTIYHEHLCYFSVTALQHLFERHGLALHRIERVPIHGGSLRLWVTHPTAIGEHTVAEMLAEERILGMDQYEYYATFGHHVERLRTQLVSLLYDLKAQGARIAVYGASAKGSTLLNAFGIGSNLLDFVVDRSTQKQGRYTPGTHLRIYPPEYLLEQMPEYVLLLTWNFADEIMAQQVAYRAQGGQFILPLPEPRIV